MHPESYEAATILLEKLGCDKSEPKSLAEALQQVNGLSVEKLSEEIGIGVPTLRDIIKELQKPGRDPRDEMPKPIFHTDVLEMKDLKPDMILTGTVRNVIDFGAFVDIGVHQDGLVHISELADKFVLEVDLERSRISLSMKGLN